MDHGVEASLQSINAVTLVTDDMSASVSFYEALGFRRRYGGPDSEFTSFHVGSDFLNLQVGVPPSGIWGRAIIWVDDVDAMWTRAAKAGYTSETEPEDAPWGERYFHIRDPSGHELSFAKLLTTDDPTGP